MKLSVLAPEALFVILGSHLTNTGTLTREMQRRELAPCLFCLTKEGTVGRGVTFVYNLQYNKLQ